MSRRLPPGPGGRVHYGATTQDIMDTGLALQMVRSLAALERRIAELGDVLADRVTEHASTVMAARTHGQQAVPTTFGATLATLLAQFTRHRQRLAEAAPRVGVISLSGAGGTAAAFGPHAAAVRSGMARLLGLRDTATPLACGPRRGRRVRLAVLVAHRDMRAPGPQHHRPLPDRDRRGLRALRRSPRRVPWRVLPELAVTAGTALTETTTLLRGLRVDARRMRAVER
ncbi:lyase family protein [Streptomyces sp. NPDC016845]|uniref:lyase family protein n=1 Tax=Streptomyces sp. NPDC016845 TaxID=3364972 RepID=UPI003795E5C8